MHDQKRLGALLAYVQWGVNMLVGIVFTPILLRHLGESEYGVYSVATSVIAFLTMLDLGFGQTLVRFYVKYRAEGDRDKADRCSGMFLEMYLVLGAAALGICALLTHSFLPRLFGAKFTPEELSILRQVLSILSVNLAASFPLSVFSSLITAQERFAFAKLMSILNTLFTYGGMLLVLRQGYRSPALAAVTTVVSIAVKLFLAWYCLARTDARPRLCRPEGEMLKSIFSFSLFIFLNILIDQLYASTDKFILGAVCGTAAVTVYTVGVQFNAYFQQLSTAISGVYLPHVTQLYVRDGEKADFSPLFLRIGHVQFLLLSFVLAGFIAFGRQFIGLIGGGQLGAPEVRAAYWIALIIMVPGIVPLSQNLGISILQAMNRHKYRSLSYLVLAVINVIVSIPLAMRWQGVGAAIGTTLALFAGQYTMMNWYYHRRIGLDIPAYWRMAGLLTLKMLPMALPALALRRLLPGGGWLLFFVKCALFTLCYLPYAWRCLLSAGEKDLIRRTLRRARRAS